MIAETFAVNWYVCMSMWQLKEYDFVMDDEIEFVQALPMAGTLNDEAVSNILISTVYTDRYTMQQQVGQFFFL